MSHQRCGYVPRTILMFAVAFIGQVGLQRVVGQPNKDAAKQIMIEWGPERNGLRCAVALASKQQKLPADEPVYVLLLTKNVSGKPVSVVGRHLLGVYKINVLGPNGKPVPFTSYGRQQIENAGSGSRTIRKLAPDQLQETQLFLSRIYDMTEAGEYKVSFSRICFAMDDTPISVSSNILTVTVVGPKIENGLGDPPKKKEGKPNVIEWGPEKNGVRCAVDLPAKLFADEPMRVAFLTKNVGKKPVSYVKGPLFDVFDIRVLAPDGKPSPLTSYGRQCVKADRDGSARELKLASGEEQKIQLHISRMYDMSEEGEYKISFSRWIWGADGTRFTVTSNVVKVRVVEPKIENGPGDPPKKKEGKPNVIEWGPEKSGVRCAVALASTRQKIPAGEPVDVSLLTKNFSAEAAVSVITEFPTLRVFTIRVLDPDGKPTPLTSYGRQQMDAASAGGSRSTRKLALGHENETVLLLSRIYDMTRTGEYKVSFSRLIWTADSTRVSVSSNVLTVTVKGEKSEYVPN